MKIGAFNIGVESIGSLRPEDVAGLPEDGHLQQLFLPETRALDAVLRRPSLDERLPAMLAPHSLDPDLLEPAVLSEARIAVRDVFACWAEREARTGARNILQAASALLANDAVLDYEVRSALAALLRG